MKLFEATTFIVFGLTAGSWATVSAQDLTGPPTYAIQYVSGDKIWKCKDACRGLLIIDAERLRITDRPSSTRKPKPPSTIFTIPFSDVKKVEASVRREDSNRVLSQGFGFPPTQDNREFITITTENEASAGALVFWVPEHKSADIVAKIEFALKKAKP